jgi:hypothetical protein
LRIFQIKKFLIKFQPNRLIYLNCLRAENKEKYSIIEKIKVRQV